MKQPLVSIIILNYNGIEFIESCLDSVIDSKYPNKEIIVVDSTSSDGSGELVKKKYGKLKNLKIIEIPRSFGTDRGRNIGAAKARGEYLMFLDNDTEVDSNWLNELITVMRSDKSIGSAQSKLLKIEPRDRFDCAGDYLGPLGFLVGRSQEAKDIGQFDFITDIFSAKSAASIIRSKIFKKIGRFDEDYFKYLEETDLSWRVWLAGYRVVFIPKSIVYHAFNTARKDFKRYYHKNIFRYYGCRNYISTLIKNLELTNLIKILPLHLGCWLTLSLFFFLKGSLDNGFYILKGVGWNFFNLGLLLKKRRLINTKIRKVNDCEIFNRIMVKRPAKFYLEIGLNCLTGKFE